MDIRLFQLAAFAEGPFTGNPAAVCPLAEWLPDATMQSIAAENNLSETAFLVPVFGMVEGPGGAPGDVPATTPGNTLGAGYAADYAIRWFTPEVEVDLCGHATLASAWVVLRHLLPGAERVRFASRSGLLQVTAGEGGDLDRLTLDFPARPPQPLDAAPGLAEALRAELAEALGAAPTDVLAARDWMAVFETAEEVAALRPDMAALARLDAYAVIATAPGRDGVDFVSRFFAPANGIPEDPATGSAHCTLVPYWAARLGRTLLGARQLSKRGAAFTCTLDGDRVGIAGRVIPYLDGVIRLDGVPRP